MSRPSKRIFKRCDRDLQEGGERELMDALLRHYEALEDKLEQELATCQRRMSQAAEGVVQFYMVQKHDAMMRKESLGYSHITPRGSHTVMGCLAEERQEPLRIFNRPRTYHP